MNKNMLVCLVLAGLVGTDTALATENGSPTTAMGVYDFGSGFLPPATPHGSFGLRTAWYSADDQKTADGTSSGNDFSLDVLSIGLSYIYMTDKTFLGARYGFGGVAPFFDMDASLRVKAGGRTLFEDEASPFAQADLQILPMMLEWRPQPGMGVTAQFQIQAPTGDYDEDRLVSPGLNHWAFSPIVGFSYTTPGGFEFSTLSQLDINTRNHATDYRNGIEYRNEFALGQHVGAWTLGVGGYYYDQLTDDDSPSLTDGDGNRAKTWAAGPALSYVEPGMPAVWLHAYQEFGAENRAEGYNMALRVAYSF
ncbi:SphA family protein [Chromohalobacter israelensis]|uniref:SphA family protein n=1 Tax=Chromohalobacter israelensis TaxID=141390 RepID=UPI001C4E58CC|nr:transporter [Chromohalobacter salexigens]